MTSRIDLERLKVGGYPLVALPHVPRPRPGERFLKGPVPWPWLEAAGRSRHRGLHVGLALWLRAGLERRARVVLPLQWLRTMGVDRYAAARGLHDLEVMSLVTVERARGRAPVVTIRESPGGTRR
jgi:hypothetical protein